jgi:hypothetical protein
MAAPAEVPKAPEVTRKIYILDKYISLSPVRKFIDESGFRPDEVIVMFDFDQTLTAKYGTTTESTRIRGREKTLHMIQHLNKDAIRWYVNTARGPGTVSAIAMLMKNNYKIPFSTSYILDLSGQPAQCTETRQKDGQYYYTNKGGKITYAKGSDFEATIGICNNIISATAKGGGEYAYAKDLALHYILSIKAKESTDLYKPKLIIFVDDDITNIQTIYTYMKEKQKDINFIGIIYEPWDHPEHPEGDRTALEYLEKKEKLIIEKITEEYSKEEDITAIDKVLEVIAKSNEDNLKVSQELSASIAKIANFISGAPSVPSSSPAAPSAPSSAPSAPSAPSPSSPAAAAAAVAAGPAAAPSSPPAAAAVLAAIKFNLSEYLLNWINDTSGYGIPVRKDQVEKWLLSEKSQQIFGSVVSRGNEQKVKKIVETENKITKDIVKEIAEIKAGGRRLRIRKTKKKNRKSNKTRSRQKRL